MIDGPVRRVGCDSRLSQLHRTAAEFVQPVFSLGMFIT